MTSITLVMLLRDGMIEKITIYPLNLVNHVYKVNHVYGVYRVNNEHLNWLEK